MIQLGRSPAASQFVLVFAFGGTVAVSLALTVFLGRALSPGDFGLFALVGALFSFARDVIDLGSSTTASRDIGRDPGSERQLLEGLYYVRRIVAFALALLAIALAFLQDDPTRRMVILAAAAVLAVLGPTAYYASFQARQALLAPSLAAFATQVLLLAACALLVARGIVGAEVAGLVVVRELALIVIVAFLGRRLVGFRAIPRPHFARIRAFYATAGIWALAALCRHLFVQADVLAVYLLRGDVELGAWAAAYRILAPALALPWMAALPLVPVLAALGPLRAGTELLTRSLRLGLGVGVLAATCTFAVAPDLVTVLYGGKYAAAPLDAVPAMRWLALAIAVSFTTEIAAAGLLAAGRVRVVLATSATGLAFKIIANAVLVPVFGFVAAAATTATIELAACAVLCIALSLRWRPLARSVAKTLAPALATGLLAVGIVHRIPTPAARLAAACCVGLLAFLALLRSAVGRDYFHSLREAKSVVPGIGVSGSDSSAPPPVSLRENDVAPLDVAITWGETRQRLAEDRVRIRAMVARRFDAAPSWLALHPSYVCVLLHRIAHYFWARKSRLLARLFTQLNSLLTGADIHPHCDLGGGLLIPHPTALTCSGSAGVNFTMMPLCGIGMLPRPDDRGAGPGLPLLGDDVWMGPGTGVLGPVRIGSGTRMQPGSGATRDALPGSLITVAMPPQRADGRVRPRRSAQDKAAASCPHASCAATLAALRADIDRHLRVRGVIAAGRTTRLGALVAHELLGVVVHRIAHLLHARGWRRLATTVSHVNFFVFRAAISPGSCIGGGVFMPHPAGIVFHGAAGTELTMYARTLCSGARPSLAAGFDEGPRLGDRVVLSGMAGVMGATTLGDDVRLGFNAQVEDDVPAGTYLASRVRFHSVPSVAAEGTASDARIAGERTASSAPLRRLMAEDRLALERLCDGDTPAPPLPAARLCATLFRLSHYCQRRRHYRLAWWCWRLNVGLTGADIDPRSAVGGGLAIPHPVGISLHVTAGRNLTVRAFAGVGAETAFAADPWAVAGRPSLGNNIDIGEHASLHGPVRVGDGARLGPGCKVMHDVAPGDRLEVPAPRRIWAPVDRQATASRTDPMLAPTR